MLLFCALVAGPDAAPCNPDPSSDRHLPFAFLYAPLAPAGLALLGLSPAFCIPFPSAIFLSISSKSALLQCGFTSTSTGTWATLGYAGPGLQEQPSMVAHYVGLCWACEVGSKPEILKLRNRCLQIAPIRLGCRPEPGKKFPGPYDFSQALPFWMFKGGIKGSSGTV